MQVGAGDSRVLVVGSKLYPDRPDWRTKYSNGFGVDMLPGEGVDLVHDLEYPLPKEFVGAFSHVECISILEHAKRPWLVAIHLEQVLVTGGTIEISVPFVWRYHPYPDDYWRMTHSALPVLFPSIEWSSLGYATVKDYYPVPTEFPTKYRKLAGNKALYRTEVIGVGRKV